MILKELISRILYEDKEQSLSILFIYSSLILLFILFIDSLIQLKTGTNVLGHGYKNGRISSLFGSEQIMGSFVVKILPLVFSFLYLVNLKKKKYININFFNHHFNFSYFKLRKSCTSTLYFNISINLFFRIQ